MWLWMLQIILTYLYMWEKTSTPLTGHYTKPAFHAPWTQYPQFGPLSAYTQQLSSFNKYMIFAADIPFSKQ